MSHDHFEGKTAKKHLIEARLKGATATQEAHGTELTGALSGGLDTAKEFAAVATLMYIAMYALRFPTVQMHYVFLFFLFGFALWKLGRSALLGWAKLERVHRLIREEKYEIEHNRAQEKEELLELYAMKGFKGKLLEEAVEVLMADDNRLLHVMLREELGLTLGSYEHPLKQSLGTLIGFLISASLLALSGLFAGFYGILGAGAVVCTAAGLIGARFQNNDPTYAAVWNGATFLFAMGSCYFFAEMILRWHVL